jgi:aerobic carbon-monoxide dehydrogenase large subunit
MTPIRAGYAGRAVLRREDDRLLRGAGAFLDDLPELPGTLFLSFVRSTYSHAIIAKIECAEARALPGVVAVITGEQIAAVTDPLVTQRGPGLAPLSRPHMAIDRAKHVGEPVAVVAAIDPYIAEDAAELVVVEYDAQPAVVSLSDALAIDAPRVYPEVGGNVVFEKSFATEDFNGEFEKACHVVSDVFTSSRMAAIPIETRGFVANFDAGRKKLTFCSPTQMPHKVRWEMSQCLRLPENGVRVLIPDVGGGFGMKAQMYPEDVVGAAAAMLLGRPVKWIQDRQDDLATSTHARDYRFEADLAFDADGSIRALRTRIHVNIGAYSTWITSAGIEAAGAGLFMIGPYRVANYAYDVFSVVSNKAPVGVYRGVAAPICAFAMEVLLDRASRELGIDPIELRRRNLIKPEDVPYRNAVGIIMDTASHITCLDRALAMSGYKEFKLARSGQRDIDGRLRGIGVACITEHTGQGSSRMRARGQSARSPGFDGASLRMEPDGKVVCHVSHTTQGQGHLTVFAQLIADELGIDIDDVRIEENDTAQMPFGTGTVASRGAVSGGGAVIGASTKIASKLKRIAGHILEVSPDDIELCEGKARVVGAGDISVTVRAIAETAYMLGGHALPPEEEPGLEAIEFYDPPTSSYSNATHVAIVAVDDRNGKVAVEDYFVVHDCGRIINPMIVDGQVHGGITQGLGEALMESMEYNEEGQPISTTLIDYIIPTTLDVPDIKVDHIETPSTTTRGGMKGAGEGGVIGAVPAVSLAIVDALCEYAPRINALPLTPPVIMRLIGKI